MKCNHAFHSFQCLLYLTLFVFIFSSNSGVNSARAATYSLSSGHKPQEEEVYLTFRYRNIINSIVVAQYEEGTFYLPVSELFKLLQIPVEVDLGRNVISGVFLSPDNQYQFNFGGGFARLNGNEISMNADDFIIGELDYFVRIGIFRELFDLNFEVDFNNLLLSLDTDKRLPILDAIERRRRRSQIQPRTIDTGYYDLKYDRKRALLDGGFLDYSFTSNIQSRENVYLYNLSAGTEFLGGDFEGTALGTFSSSNSNFVTDDLRWRYAFRNNEFLTNVMIGQNSSNGLINRSYTGIRLSNEPIEPRILFDEYIIEGNAIPESEVELYLNNALIDYQETDGSGNYRFSIPLTYGSTNLKVIIYNPSGNIREIDRRVQVPFTFLPAGEVNYNIYAGKPLNPLLPGSNNEFMVQSDVAIGINSWLTGKLGVEYFNEMEDTLPLIYSSLSARIASQYLFNVDIAPTAFYRASSSVVYPSSLSWNLEYTYYPTTDGVYNLLGSRHNIFANTYIPFRIGSIPFNFRISADNFIDDFNNSLRYRFDFGSRIGRFLLRTGLSDLQQGVPSFTVTPSSIWTSSLSYITPRSGNLPKLLQGNFFRLQANFRPSISQFENVEFQLSRNILENSRFQISLGRNFIGEFNTFNFSLVLDLNRTRSTSTFRSLGSNLSYTQSLRGSIGYDAEYGKVILDNRQQVGRSAASVRLFVDENNSGEYNEGEQIIQDNAVRLDRAGLSRMDENGIIRLTQLQSYYRLDLEINTSAIRNPLLIPRDENFSFIADPNQYKPIDIPFYTSGIIEGIVEMQEDSATRPLPGLRVYLQSTENDFEKTMRTFTDGGFYAYEIPPGDYRLFIDESQLEFLNAVPTPQERTISVEPRAEGDYLDNLNFLLRSREEEKQLESITERTTTSSDDTTQYQIQIASFVIYENALEAVEIAEKQFDRPFSIKHNPRRTLYAVRTLPITGLQTAVEQLLSIQNSQFSQPALVVLSRNQKVTENGDQTFSVQIGAFSTRRRAERFIEDSEDRLNLELTFVFDPEDRLYKVRTSSMENRGDAERRLEVIRNRTLFSDAFIPPETPVIYDGTDFTYQVRIEGISAQSEKAYLDQITGKQGISDAEINAGPETEVVLFDDISAWREAVELKQKLSKISKMGQPVIMLIEKD